MYTIDFEPIGRRGPCLPEQSLLVCARQLSVDIVSICGGAGSCGRCKVQVISGEVTPLNQVEKKSLTAKEIKQGYRLACQVFPLSDVKVHVPPASLSAPQRTQVEGLDVDVKPEPMIETLDISLTPPTLEKPVADDVAVWNAVDGRDGHIQRKIDFSIQQNLSPFLRENNWNLRIALRNGEIIGMARPDGRWLGLAVDIGTTKIAGYLVDLETGHTLASRGLMNPQISYGEDVVSRIAAVNRSAEEGIRLQTLLVEALNQIAEEMCQEIGAVPTEIVDAVVVGNTAIHHLFLHLPVYQLGLSPYVPAIRDGITIKARDIGLKFAQGAYLHCLPNIAGYVGADHVSMLLATRILDRKGIVLAIDIGTNTEICLTNNGKMFSVSCASGPAFEGAHIKFGMRASSGAIEHIQLDGEVLKYQTIGSAPAVGVCGSGLLDAVAQFYINGVVDRGGRLLTHSRVRTIENNREFVLVDEDEREGLEPITISQKDIRQLQLAKGAIRLGIQALADATGINESDIEHVCVAGAFGTYIDINSAIAIGMFPDLPRERFEQVGNAAGTGARLALISKSQRLKAAEIARRDGYIELSTLPGIQRRFADATLFPNQ